MFILRSAPGVGLIVASFSILEKEKDVPRRRAYRFIVFRDAALSLDLFFFLGDHALFNQVIISLLK